MLETRSLASEAQTGGPDDSASPMSVGASAGEGMESAVDANARASHLSAP